MREALAAEPTLAGGLVEPAPPLVLAPLAADSLGFGRAEGLDLILEGFLLHHGHPRHLALTERGRRVLAGDYCYAQGLVRVAAVGDLWVIEALADLIALGAELVARKDRASLPALWLATARAIAERRAGAGAEPLARFMRAKQALRRDGDAGPLRALADGLPGADELARAFAA